MRRRRVGSSLGERSESSPSRFFQTLPEEVTRLSDGLYELHKPRDGVPPTVEIVFFHGLLHFGNYSMPFIDTWTSFDGSTPFCWPRKFLATDYPEARILSARYDSSITEGDRKGRIDLYCTAENLIQDLTGNAGKVAHLKDCPVILVGQDFGGLIIKAVCRKANEEQRRHSGCKSFLNNIKGIFYYCTPHLGLHTLPPEFTSELATKLGVHNKDIARLNEDFRELRADKKWRAKAIGAASPGDQSRVEISEASLRYDVDPNSYYTASEGVDNVCKPKETNQIGYTFLKDLVQEFVGAGSQHSLTKLITGESSLGFKERDDRYVPMMRSFGEVQNAFEKSNIVVLYGGAGTGKSSFARYYALQESRRRAPGVAFIAAQASTIPSVATVFVACGRDASIVNKQEELLRKFKVELDQDFRRLLNSYRISILEYTGQSSTRCNATEKHLVQVLYEALDKYLMKHHALVVLDDVWESELIQKVLVQGAECKLQYLVTTRNSNLWNDAEKVMIQGIDVEDALKIFANYADLPGGEIPIECKAIATDIVSKVQSHPLALATLGTVIRTEKSNWRPETMVTGWKELRSGLMRYLKSADYKPSAFGEAYPKSVYASMKKMVKLLEEDEKRLLHVITLFEGPSISEAVVQLFLMYIRPEEGLDPFRSRRQKLETRNLIQVETKDLFTPEEQHFGGYVEGPTRTEYRFLTYFRIHNLQQQFILEKNKADIYEITSFLDAKWKFRRRGTMSNLHMTTLLCALFGVKSVKEKAMAKIGDSRAKSMCVDICNAAPLALTALVSLMAAIFKKETSIENSIVARAVTKVFWTLLVDGSLDDKNISYLLGTREWKKWTCVFLEELGSAISGASFDSQARSLTHESSISDVRGRKGLTIQMNDAFYLPRSLDKLVTFLSHDEEAWMQTRALAKLTLAGTDDDGKFRYNLRRTRRMLRSFIMFLSNPNEMEDRRLLAARLTREIFLQVKGSVDDSCELRLFIPHVGKLVELLTEDVPTRIQQEVLCGLRLAIQAICRMTDPLELRAVLNIPGLLRKVVRLLAVEQTRSSAIALVDTLLDCFRSSEEAIPYVIRRAALFPGCFETMVELLIGMLAQDEHHVDAGDKDRVALEALYLIAISGEGQILARLTETRGLLEMVTTRLTNGEKDVCLAAATFVRCLSREMCPSISISIVEQEGCLENLVGLLDEDVAEDIQVEALKALISLSKSNDVRVCHRILETEGLVEQIVACVTNDREILMSKIFSISFCQKSYYRRRYFRNPFHLRRPSFNPFYFDVCPFEDSRGLKASLFASLVANPFMRAPLKKKLAVLKGKSLGVHIHRAVEFAHVVILAGFESSGSGHGQREQGMVHGRGVPMPAVDPDGVNSSELLFWRNRRESFGEMDFSMKFFSFLCASLADFFILLGEDAKHNVIESPLSLEMSPLFFVGFQVGVLCFLSFVLLFRPPWDFVLVFWNTLTLGSPFYFYLVCMQSVVPVPMWFIASNLFVLLSTICCCKMLVCVAFELVNFWFSFLVLTILLVYLGVAFSPLVEKVTQEKLQTFFALVTFSSVLKDCWDHFSLYVWTTVYLYVFFLVYSWWPRWTKGIREFLFNWALHWQSFLVSFIGACDFFLDVFGFFGGAYFLSFLWSSSKRFQLPWTAGLQDYVSIGGFLVLFSTSSLLDIAFPCPVKFMQIFSFAVGFLMSCGSSQGSSLDTLTVPILTPDLYRSLTGGLVYFVLTFLIYCYGFRYGL